MIRKTLFLLLFWTFFVPIGSAQTIQWVIKPKYDTICHLNGCVFKCKTGDRVQLVNAKGRELLTPIADSVTNFSGNRALVLDKIGNRIMIRGIIDELGVLTTLSNELYVNNYSYCSEGLISVVDKSGRAGYIDVVGNIVIPCKYRVARPFIQGWASVEPVKKKQQTQYINNKGDILEIQGFHEGKVIMGSSFNSSGEALVAYYDNDNAVINTSGKVVEKYEKQGDLIPVRTYDFSFDKSGKNSIPNVSPDITFDADYFTFMMGKKIGYKNNNRIVVPPQFSQAERFVNGCAIVCKDEKYGIVKLVDGSFSGEFDGDELNVAEGKQAPTYSYTLVVPDGYPSETLDVKFDVGDGNLQSLKEQDGKYEFTPFLDDNADVCLMKMQVMSDGLLLWADTLRESVSNVSLDISAPEALSEWANEHDELRVRSVLTNNSSSQVTVSGIFYANFAKGSKNKVGKKKSFWGKIPPQGKLEVFADLIVVQEESAKVSVSVKVNQKHTFTNSTIIQLKPFD